MMSQRTADGIGGKPDRLRLSRSPSSASDGATERLGEQERDRDG